MSLLLLSVPCAAAALNCQGCRWDGRAALSDPWGRSSNRSARHCADAGKHCTPSHACRVHVNFIDTDGSSTPATPPHSDPHTPRLGSTRNDHATYALVLPLRCRAQVTATACRGVSGRVFSTWRACMSSTWMVRSRPDHGHPLSPTSPSLLRPRYHPNPLSCLGRAADII